jgi:hypothetical protein
MTQSDIQTIRLSNGKAIEGIHQINKRNASVTKQMI